MKPAIANILFALLLSLPGCSYYDIAPGPDAGGSDFCLSHSDCSEEERCIDNRCYTDPPPCGEEVAPECGWGREEEECYQKGGSWQCSYISPDFCWCDCPTGQGGCPCWSAAHCRGDCVIEEDGLSFDECENQKIGVCTARTTNLGCWCAIWFFSGDDSFSYGCAD